VVEELDTSIQYTKRKRVTVQEIQEIRTIKDTSSTPIEIGFNTTLLNSIQPSGDPTYSMQLSNLFAEHVEEEKVHEARERAWLPQRQLQRPPYLTRLLFEDEGIDMTARKISCLQTDVWLNDEVINNYEVINPICHYRTIVIIM
jgi:hypothetical protein